MRALNHEYIFVQPLREATGFSQRFKEITHQLGQTYLSEGDTLLHGDYFPGSWLQTEAGVRVIDPEFAFFGPPEFDAGVLLAHLYMANQPTEAAEATLKTWCNPKLTRQFAGIEIMRRILGVAQLPLTASQSEKEALLEISKEFVLA
jgi:5-methylthioribose kinase